MDELISNSSYTLKKKVLPPSDEAATLAHSSWQILTLASSKWRLFCMSQRCKPSLFTYNANTEQISCSELVVTKSKKQTGRVIRCVSEQNNTERCAPAIVAGSSVIGLL